MALSKELSTSIRVAITEQQGVQKNFIFLGTSLISS